MRTFIAITLLMMAGALPAAVPTLPPTTAQALDALTAAERTFAKTARVKGWRAAFLEFFSPDAIALAPDPTSAVARLKIQPVRPFAEEELTWEPRAGDVAVSGELGWLTGPSIFIDHTAQNPSPTYGNYLSVWKKATDGSWRVFIDVGTRASSPVSFPSWFTHVTAVPRYRGTELPSQSAARLLDADRELNSALSSSAVAREYLLRIVPRARLHRVGTDQPVSVGADEIARWFAGNPEPMLAKTSASEAAASGDLGYTYGRYELSGASRQHGAYVRVWSRQADGRWCVAADVTVPVHDAS